MSVLKLSTLYITIIQILAYISSQKNLWLSTYKVDIFLPKQTA